MRRLLLMVLLFFVGACELVQVPNQVPVQVPILDSTNNSSELILGTWNIQIFGQSKAGKAEVVKVLKSVVQSFDVIAIQEFRDVEGTTIPFFLNQLNQEGVVFAEVHSPPLGRSSSKENYAFYYKKGKITLIDSYTYNDVNDVFEREPFLAYFKSGSFDFVMVNIHTKPDDATNEIGKLANVVRDAQQHWNEQDVIVLGDYNADGSYFDEEGMSAFKASEFVWVVPNSFDTTVAISDNTYDRIVITPSTQEDYANHVEVVRYDQLYGLDLEQTKDVSDHYPIRSVFTTTGDSD